MGLKEWIETTLWNCHYVVLPAAHDVVIRPTFRRLRAIAHPNKASVLQQVAMVFFQKLEEMERWCMMVYYNKYDWEVPKLGHWPHELKKRLGAKQERQCVYQNIGQVNAACGRIQ